MYLDKNTSKSVAKILYNYYFLMLYFLLNIYRRFFPIECIVTPVIDPIKNYLEIQKEKFITISFNENTDKVFYSKKEYQELLENPDNYLEKKWKHNILFESTPRGNIIMYYDAYKQGFSYYCDTSGISYDILNAVAMKYVYVFRCKDFFIDQNITEDKKSSPLIDIYYKEEEKKEVKKKENNFDNAPFAKLKNYSNVQNKDGTPKEKQVEKIKNKFVNLGRICNFKILQSPHKKKHMENFKSTLMENLSSENLLQKDVLSYKNFKLKQHQL
jgi:hypothetical protein